MHIVFSSKEEKERAAKVIASMRMNTQKISAYIDATTDFVELGEVLEGLAMLIEHTNCK